MILQENRLQQVKAMHAPKWNSIRTVPAMGVNGNRANVRTNNERVLRLGGRWQRGKEKGAVCNSKADQTSPQQAKSHERPDSAYQLIRSSITRPCTSVRR